jgi:predicted enzyme related to lactoylglutathione lyase
MMAYFYVVGMEGTVEQAVANGGEIVKGIYPEGNLRVAVLRDPAGNLIGVWEEG